MAQTNIYVGVKNQSTTTTAYPVRKGDHLNFHNVGPDVLTVTFTNTPLCLNGVSQPTVVVPAGGVSGTLKVCQGAMDGDYPFTNQITGFAAEDPIVIIEGIAPSPFFSLLRDPIVIIEAVLVVVALAAGYALGKRHAARKAQASAGRH